MNNTTLTILVAALLFLIIVILFVACWFIRKRRGYNQSPVGFSSGNESTVLIPPRSKAKTNTKTNPVGPKSDDSSLLLSCQFYLRTTGDYTVNSKLPEIGANTAKSWFLLNQTGNNTAGSHLLTIQPKSERLNQLNDEESTIAYVKTLNNLFNRLYHPYVEPMEKLDILYSQKLVITIKKFQRSGSLRDLIQNVMPIGPFDVMR